MRKTKSVIPDSLRKELALDPFYSVCSLYGHHGHECEGRITWEHAIRAGGRNLQLKWGIIPLCAKGHDVDEFQDSHSLVKELNEWVSLSRASIADILALFAESEVTPLSKSKFLVQHRKYLIEKYGEYRTIPKMVYYRGIPMMEKSLSK